MRSGTGAMPRTTCGHRAIEWHENGLDFADAFHLAQSQQHDCLYSFDEKFIKKANGLTSCEVKNPFEK